MKPYLKVKIKSLTAETKIIKADEQKYLWAGRIANIHAHAEELPENERVDFFLHKEDSYETYRGLHEHRINVVRSESRAAQLALAFYNKTPYHEVEASCYTLPNWDRVAEILIKFFNIVPMDVTVRYEEGKRRQRAAVKKELAEWHGKLRQNNKQKYIPETLLSVA
jgi:hypothetical protein